MMQKRTLGKTGIEVSPLGFGAMRLPMVEIGGEEYVDLDRAVEVIQHGFEQGINYVDTGFLYCAAQSEIAVGRALRGWREKVTLTTKATKMRLKKPGDMRRMLEHQLARLEQSHVDFYCFHGIGFDNFHTIDKEVNWIRDMTDARDEGLVRHIAFSFHDKPESLIKLVDLGLFEMVTCQYNYLDQQNAEAMAHAHEAGLGVVVMGPVGGGRLAGLSGAPGFVKNVDGLDASSASGLALRFVLSNPHVHSTISGMGSIAMVDENVAAARAGALSEEEQKTLLALLDKTKKLSELYCTGCGYCMPCSQGVNIPARFEAMNCFKVYGMEEHARNRYKRIRNREAKNEGEGVCTACGACVEKCPQEIAIVEQLKETEAALAEK